MQTPIQELILDLQQECKSYFENNEVYLKALIVKEKQQIIDAFNQGYREGEVETITSSKEDISEFDDAKNYYNKIFNKE